MKRALLFMLLWPLASAHAAMGLFEKNDPRVQAGMNAEEKGDYAVALEQYELAQKDFPTSAQLEFNRGHALHKLGRYDEAKQAFERALERDTGALANKIHFNLGNVLAAMDKKREAIAEYRQALRVKPDDALARHNMEVLLKNLPLPPPPTPDAGMPGDGGPGDAGHDGGQPDGGRDGGFDGGTDGGNRDGGQGDGGAPGDGGTGDGGQGDKGTPRERDGGSDGGNGEAGRDGGRGDGGSEQSDGGVEDSPAIDESRDGGTRMSKQEAERLLDSMKNSEKNLQLWRFQKKKTRAPDGKDW